MPGEVFTARSYYDMEVTVLSARTKRIRNYVHVGAAAQITGFRSEGGFLNFVKSWNDRNPKKPIRKMDGGYYHARDLYEARKDMRQ